MLFKNDYGAELLVQTNVDLTGATALTFEVEKPDDSMETWTAAIPTGLSGTDGYMTYTIQSGDLDQAGDYNIQAKRVAAGISQRGGTFVLKVLEHFE